MILSLDENDKARLKRLREQKDTLFSLKKLFLNAFSERPPEFDVQFLAAQRIAYLMLDDVFHDLENILPNSPDSTPKGNLI